jgi:hypothetical protein
VADSQPESRRAVPVLDGYSAAKKIKEAQPIVSLWLAK